MTATEVHQFTLTIPAGTAQATPVTLPFGVAQRVVEQIDIDVPPGTAGLVGFYLTFNGVRIIPFEAGEYLVWDDYSKEWPLEDLPTTGVWALVGYNTGADNHKVAIRQHTSYPTQATMISTPSVSVVQSPDASAVVLA